MKTNTKYSGTRRPHLVAAAFAAFVAIALGAATGAEAGRVAVVGNGHANADIRVWIDETWDVYPSYDDVVISIRAERDCYATVYLVDTEGFVHLIHPFSRYDDAWIEGGVTYRYQGREIGLGALGGRGVAFVFAVGSPYDFNYAAYGDGLFIGRYGYRIYGDPFVASRQFYVSLLPARCDWAFVNVSFASFYVREWARYPRYLCHGHHGSVHVRAGDYCRHCYRVYDNYRIHAGDPYRVIRPTSRYKAAGLTQIKSSKHAYKTRVRDRFKSQKKVTPRSVNKAKIVSSKQSTRTKMTARSSGYVKTTKSYKSVKVSKSSGAASGKSGRTRTKTGASR